MNDALTARLRLDPVQLSQKFPRRQERLKLQASVEEIILIRHTIGRRLDQIRYSLYCAAPD